MDMRITILVVLSVLGTGLAFDNTTDYNFKEQDKSSKVLSRRKRFIIFPEGSSFQLVFCTQTHGYLQVGDIVWFGNTAALAWMLPDDPELFNTLKEASKDYKDLRRHDSIKNIYYLDEDGKVLRKVPYRKRLIVNPAFAKRSTDDKEIKAKISKSKLHERHRNSSVFTEMHENRIIFHRDNRKDLYEKLEKFFQGLGWNGRECVLRMLCETGKDSVEQGTFLEEIMRATFTLPKDKRTNVLEDKYDDALIRSGNCATLYPKCSNLYPK